MFCVTVKLPFRFWSHLLLRTLLYTSLILYHDVVVQDACCSDDFANAWSRKALERGSLFCIYNQCTRQRKAFINCGL